MSIGFLKKMKKIIKWNEMRQNMQFWAMTSLLYFVDSKIMLFHASVKRMTG